MEGQPSDGSARSTAASESSSRTISQEGSRHPTLIRTKATSATPPTGRSVSSHLPTGLPISLSADTRAPGSGYPSGLALLAQLVEHLHGKEGVDGSSPSEGFRKFLLISSFRCRRGRRRQVSASTGRPRAGDSFSDKASNRCC